MRDDDDDDRGTRVKQRARRQDDEADLPAWVIRLGEILLIAFGVYMTCSAFDKPAPVACSLVSVGIFCLVGARLLQAEHHWRNPRKN